LWVRKWLTRSRTVNPSAFGEVLGQRGVGVGPGAEVVHLAQDLLGQASRGVGEEREVLMRLGRLVLAAGRARLRHVDSFRVSGVRTGVNVMIPLTREK
jgi:hypothetical protein